VAAREVRTLVERTAGIYEDETNDDGNRGAGNVVDAELRGRRPQHQPGMTNRRCDGLLKQEAWTRSESVCLSRRVQPRGQQAIRVPIFQLRWATRTWTKCFCGHRPRPQRSPRFVLIRLKS
jgi:hypothetical protein